MKFQAAFAAFASMLIAAGVAHAQDNSSTVKLPTAEGEQNKPAEGASTATLEANVPKENKKFGFSLYDRTDTTKGSLQDKSPDSTQLTRVTGKYNLTDSKSIGYTQEFQYFYGKGMDWVTMSSRSPGTAVMNDGWLQYTDSKLAHFGNDWNLTGLVREYVPIGEYSRFVNKRMGAEVGMLILENSFGKLDFGYYMIGTYHNQTQDFYYDASGNRVANMDYEFDHYLSAEYNFSQYFSVSEFAGTEHLWMRGVSGDGVNRLTLAYTETGLSVKPNKKVAVTASIFNETPFDSQNAVTFFKDAETGYRLLLNVSM